MHIPKLYKETDDQTILEFLKGNNFPALVTFDGEKPIASHLPVEVIEENGQVKIYSHMSRVNPQWKTFSEREALMIFQGAHTYISPRWYNHVNVPTWNYMMAHVYGTVQLIEGADFLALLSRLVSAHEQNSGYSLETLPDGFAEKEMKGAIGFVMEVTRIEAGYKLSQNRNDEDHANIIRELDNRKDLNSTEIAEAMRQNRES